MSFQIKRSLHLEVSRRVFLFHFFSHPFLTDSIFRPEIKGRKFYLHVKPGIPRVISAYLYVLNFSDIPYTYFKLFLHCISHVWNIELKWLLKIYISLSLYLCMCIIIQIKFAKQIFPTNFLLEYVTFPLYLLYRLR